MSYLVSQLRTDTEEDSRAPVSGLEILKGGPLLISTDNFSDSSTDSLALQKNNTNSAEVKQAIMSYLKIHEIEKNFDTITREFENSIHESLQKSQNCMLPCFNVVCDSNCLPDEYYAVIDIGGSTLRISVIKFLEENKAECIINKSWVIFDDNKHLDQQFFEWIAGNFKSLIANDMKVLLENSRGSMKVGITWSFPLLQIEAPNRAVVSDLGKGFSVCLEFKGKDLKDIFEESFTRFGLDIEIYAIINDSVSGFVAGSYLINSKLGLVQGTGVNSCFFVDKEKLSYGKIGFLKPNFGGEKILVNAEASFLGYHLFPHISEADKEMNPLWDVISEQELPYPHMTTGDYGVFQPLEVITSGRYIPEIIRRIFMKTMDMEKHSEGGAEYSLSAELLGELCLSDDDDDDDEVRGKLCTALQLEYISKDEIGILKIITEVVIHRASIVLASYIIAMLRVSGHIDTDILTISVVGSMLQHFPRYKETVLEILGNKKHIYKLPNITFGFVEDSSIYGAAIAACATQRSLCL